MTPDSLPPRSTTETASVPPPASPAERTLKESPSTDFMILADGTIYARNLTPSLASMLATFNPHDASMALRAATILPLP